MAENESIHASVCSRKYSGHYTRALDEKNRVAIPPVWRFQGVSVLHAIPDSKRECLRLVDDMELERNYRAIEDSGLSAEDKKLLKDRWFSQAIECPIDKQHRVLLPQAYRDRYRFEGEVFLAGGADFFTVWRPDTRANSTDEQRVAKMAGELGF